MRTKSLKKNKINVITLGCSKNVYDSEVLMGQLKASGKDVVHEQEGNIVVINTCGFINNAKEESVNTILEYVDKKEQGIVDKVFVTGCLSERYRPDLEKEIPDVDKYFGTTELPQLLKALGADYKHELLGERLTTTPKNYAYLKIAEGCDRPCSFCAIPLMRGKHVSQPIEKLVKEAEGLAANGVKELILIAQDLTYYGLDLYKKRNLAELLENLVKVEGIEWIRLHYAFPTGFPMDVLELMKNEPKICNYIDIPLQHISDNILKSMRRGTTYAKTTQLLKDFRTAVPGMAIRTTLIVGYPGETEEDFQILLDWLVEAELDRVGCFTYSPVEGATANDLPDHVPEEIKQERYERFMQVQQQISAAKLQKRIGQTMTVLVDSLEDEYPVAVARSYADAPEIDGNVFVEDIDKSTIQPGDMLEVEITDADEYDLFAKLIKIKSV